MGRELKRVPLSFDWPPNVVWKGYRNPYHGSQCDLCQGSGYSPKAKELQETFYDCMAPGARGWRHSLTQDELDALHDSHVIVEGVTHRWDNGWQPIEPRLTLQQAQVVLSSDRGLFALDAIRSGILLEARCKRLGVPLLCSLCKGTGELWCDPKYEQLREEWERIDPPEGPGYQLWSTTSEGAPISPVFETLDALCDWAEPNATTFAHCKTTAAQWKEMLTKGHVFHREGNDVFL